MPRALKTFDSLPDNALEIIEEMAATGYREVDIARALDTSWQVFNRIRQENESVANAFEAGRGREHQALVSKLYEKAMKGDTVAALFLLKTRHGYREGHVVEHRSNVDVRLILPEALPAESYGKVVNSLPHNPERDQDHD